MTGPILLTGAAGFVGGHLIDLLARDEAPLVGWYRPDAPPSPTYEQRPVTWVAIDLLDRRAVEEAIAALRPAAVYHLAGAAHVAESWRSSADTYRTNVIATHYLLDAIRATGDRPRVLIAGSATIYRPQPRPLREDDPLAPGSPYATSKLAQEMLARRAWTDDRIPTLLARSFNHVGPGQAPTFVAPSVARQIALIEAGRQEPVLTLGNLDAERDLTDVRDTVRAYTAMMRDARPGEVYNVCSGRPLSIRALVDAFTERAHCPVRIVQDPARLRPNDPLLLVGDHGRLSADTGWQPVIPFDRTVDDLLEYWRRDVRERKA